MLTVFGDTITFGQAWDKYEQEGICVTIDYLFVNYEYEVFYLDDDGNLCDERSDI